MTTKGKPKKQKSGVTLTNLDRTVLPNVDFYQFACGGWMKLNPLGAEYARYGNFDQLGENNQKQLQDLVTKLAAQKNAPGTVEQKLGDLYNIGMNTEQLERQGNQPIQAELQKIARLQRNQLSTQLAEMLLEGHS